MTPLFSSFIRREHILKPLNKWVTLLSGGVGQEVVDRGLNVSDN